MALQLFRDSSLGQGLRIIARPSWLQYPEERDGHSDIIECTSKIEDSNGDIKIVDWYGKGDPENPLNWSSTKKAWVVFVIGYYSFVVYMAAPIYSPGKEAFKHEFNVNPAESSLGLALYVLGYGAGPLLFSPLSEIPRFGRNLPYVISFIIFTILCIPTGFAPSAIGFYFLRFLQGFFGSPCLATGGASISDVYDPYVRPYAMAAWVCCIFCAPAIGMLVSGFAIPVLGWRFSMWEILMAAGPALILILLLPETSPSTILYRRAQRLQATDGSKQYRTAAELTQSHISFHDIIRESLLTPIKITLLDPAILFVNIYTSLVYAIYYTFFEAFPLVYMDIYNFNLGQMGTAFLAIVIGTTISVVIYNIYNYLIFIPQAKSKSKSTPCQNQDPEELLTPALVACFGPSIGLFLFGWASRPEIHWIVPTLGIVIYPGCVFVLMQSVFLYIPACYPEHAASVFAAADFMRSAFACGAVVFSRPLFGNLGVGGGCSLLAGLTVLCIGGIYLLRFYGGFLRRRSRFGRGEGGKE
ncbi:MFS general substrate transporter [Aspergillus pseudotamarii]|uniref:MFS general substrate transporter n=1 Tax=Aspergillus pseudotamarii TaxID=132259 RepID=A0A5N6T490_ASPPS|nr:MFS general substrate transporter [Aspergillus pseudotamarii]KAE8141021.1 MFS general substrate transporter [Aspergillus pseudotamarii]